MPPKIIPPLLALISQSLSTSDGPSSPLSTRFVPLFSSSLICASQPVLNSVIHSYPFPALAFRLPPTTSLFYSLCPQCAWRRLVIFNHSLPPVLPRDFSILCSTLFFKPYSGLEARTRQQCCVIFVKCTRAVALLSSFPLPFSADDTIRS